jgi:hypothetical protein
LKTRATIGSSRTRAAFCPYCLKVLDGVTGVAFDSNVAPTLKPDDLSICAYCGEVLRWDGRGYRAATAKEAAELYSEHPWLRDFVRERIAKVKERKANAPTN